MNRGTLRRSPSTPVMNQPSGSLTISSIETPSPNGTNALNRPAQPSQSLYQLCLELLKRLYCVDGFEQYLEQGHRNIQNNASIGTPTSETLPNGILHGDPVTLLWQTFRLGYPLCALFNAMKPEKQIPLEFTEPPNLSKTSIQATTNKKSVYHFLVKCKEELGLKQDEMFQITSLFKDDTNDFVKVINTVKCVVDKIEEKDLLNLSRRELLGNSDPMEPTDNRARVVQEILETERKYVQDMEVLQDYARKLQSAEVVSVDTIHHLFANLNQLVDFQRRFLIGVEHHASLSPSEQRFGYLFVQMEENFEVYQPFCANYQSASELVIQETPNLQKLKGVVEPTYELPSLLIKPIQRICKYPLLLQELLKYTEKTNNPYYEEIERGLKAIKRVADRVNETRRLQENEAVVKDLERRVEDWKGHDISSFGSLLLEDVFVMSKDDSEREYHVYLFERILLCCKETAKQNARGAVLRNNSRRQKRASLQLKGRIFIHNITAVLDNSRSGSWSLKVYWRGDTEMESFSLKCRNEEQLKQWQATLEKLLQENRNNQSTNSSKGSSDTPSSAIRRTGVSNTQLASLQNLDLPPYSRRKNLDDDDDSDDDNDDDNASFMEDEEEDGEEEDDDDDYDWAMKQSRSQSLPYGQFPSHNFGRKPRPDESTAVSSPYNFRSDTVPIPNMPPSHQQQYHRHPNMSMPPLPRNGFTTAPPSTTMFPSAALQNEYGHNNPNSNHNYNNYIPSSPPQSHSGSPAQSARSSGSAGSHSMSIWQRRSIEHPSPLTDTIAKFMAEEKEFVPQQQQPSFQRAQSVSASSGHILQQVNNQPPQYPAHAHPISRLRSQSSPNIHVIQETSWDTTEPVPDLQNASLSQSDNSRFRSPQQRNSGSSTSSQHSIHTSTTSPTGSISSHTLTSPISNGSTNGHHHSSFGYASASFSNTMKIKVNFAEYVFLIVVPQETDYQELCERIERKIRSCPSGRDESLQIRIKYQDEDGDYITINSNEDIQMAFDGRNFVNLYVSN